MPAPRPYLRRAAARQGAARRPRQGSSGRQEAGQGHPRAGGLSRRAAAHDRERDLRRQRHRARHRLAAAPQPGRVLRPRPRQDPQLGEAALLRARHSLPRLLARLRVRRQGLRVRAHRPAAQAPGHDPAARARLQRRADARHLLREEHLPPLARRAWSSTLVPQRLRGETASFEIRAGNEGDRRGRPAHHGAARPPARGGRREPPARAYRLPRRQGARARRRQHRDGRDPGQGERDPRRGHDREAGAGRDQRDPRAVRERPRPGSLHLGHAAHRPDQEPHGGAGRDLPHDASGRAADARCGGKPVPEPVLQPRALRPLGCRPHEVQPARRPRRDQGRGDPVRPAALRPPHRRRGKGAGRSSTRRPRTSSTCCAR